jgi:hypothetical protein
MNENQWPETMATYGAEMAPPVDDEIRWASPPRPPWAGPPKKKRTPFWSVLSVVVGGIFLMCAGGVIVAAVGESGPTPAVYVPSSPAVSTTGTCEKKIIGEYGLIATVTAVNATAKTQTGTLWARWPITGEAAQEFTKQVTLAPGESAELLVNENIPAERWYRVGACSYGWAPDAP